MNSDEIFMRRCLDLAGRGLGHIAPNPLVGAVIVHDGQIIGEGFHHRYGGEHAEAHAIGMVQDKHLLKEATLYVNLEPCNHQGKTPPCTDLILSCRIPKVVIGQKDPHPLVSGSGIARLQENGVEVVTGVLAEESRFLNRRFNTFHGQKRPYIILKWAQTADGFVDTLRDGTPESRPTWITDETCRRLVHKWRSEEQAILVGSRTILLDNPQLNVRVWAGKNPLRISIDRSGSLLKQTGSKPLHLTDGTQPTWIFTNQEQPDKPNLHFITLSPDKPVWQQVMDSLHRQNILSVLVEGGPMLLNTLIQEGSWDEARVFIGPGWFGTGIKAPELPGIPASRDTIGNSELLTIYRA